METGLIISSVLLWVVVLANLLLTLALVRRINADPRSAQAAGLTKGAHAPDFTAQTLNGETVTRSTYVGRSVAFVFISTHCSPCRDLLPRLEPLGSQAAQAGTELVLVSADELEETRTFAVELDTHLPILVAPRTTNSFLSDYKSPGTPSYCLIDGLGKVQLAGYPNMEHGEWKSLVDSWAEHNAPVV